MTMPIALVALAGFLGLLLVLSAAHAPRLLRHGRPPARPRRFWTSLVVGRELGLAGAAATAACLAPATVPSLPPWAAAAAAGAVAFLVVEVVGPAIGLALPAALVDRLEEWTQRGLGVLRRPLERPAVLLANAVAGEAGLAAASVLRFTADGTVGEDEEAALDGRGRELLARVRTLRQRPVRAIMTPRVHVAALAIDTGRPELLATTHERRFTRVPVYRGERDNVVGILYAKDLLGRDTEAPGFRLEPLLRPPVYVPVGMRAGDVFRELRRRRVHLALVVDEYGGIAGLVTMEDLLDELFGDAGDPGDA